MRNENIKPFQVKTIENDDHCTEYLIRLIKDKNIYIFATDK